MPRKGRSNEEIITALHQVEGGEKVHRGLSSARGQRADASTAGRSNSPALGLSGAPRAAIAPSRKQQAEAAGRRPDARSPHPAGDRPKKAVRPRARCTLAEWAQTDYRLSQRRAARLIPVPNGTLVPYTRDPQEALRQRLRELAAVRVRFRLSTADGAVETRRLDGECEADLSPLRRRGPRPCGPNRRKKLASRARVPRPRHAAQ